MLVVSHEVGYACQVPSRVIFMDAGPDHRALKSPSTALPRAD